MPTPQKEAQTKLMKGLLDLVVLQLLNQQPMHGYQIITRIRKSFGVYFGPSTIYPFMAQLEKKGYIKSRWNTDSERPRKVYTLTNDGKVMLNFTEDSLNLLCQKLGTPTLLGVTVESGTISRKAVLPPLTIR
jgi:PadR family transcriptional regulator PadR